MYHSRLLTEATSIHPAAFKVPFMGMSSAPTLAVWDTTRTIARAVLPLGRWPRPFFSSTRSSLVSVRSRPRVVAVKAIVKLRVRTFVLPIHINDPLAEPGMPIVSVAGGAAGSQLAMLITHLLAPTRPGRPRLTLAIINGRSTVFGPSILPTPTLPPPLRPMCCPTRQLTAWSCKKPNALEILMILILSSADFGT